MEVLKIRPVMPSDACAVADIYRYYVENTTVTFDEEAPAEEDIRETITRISQAWPYLVAEADGVVVGYCYVHPWKEKIAYRTTLETTVYLRQGFTSHGVGRRLMEALMVECKSKGNIHSLIACITAENEGSRRFHSRLCFKEVSFFREVGYKFGRYLDVVDMELIL